MSDKVFYFDTETTGLDAKVNSIIQLAGLVEIDGRVVEEIELKMRHTEPDDLVTEDAIKTHGMSIAEIKKFPAPAESKSKLDALFAKYVDKFDKGDKFSIAGKNVRFDVNFLQEFYKRQGDNYLFSYLNSRSQIDVQPLIDYCRRRKYIDTPNSRLEATAKYFGIKIQAHDALSDIKATREIYKKIEESLVWLAEKQGNLFDNDMGGENGKRFE